MINDPDFGPGSSFVSPGPLNIGHDGFPTGDVSSLVLVIYLHGSEKEIGVDNFVLDGKWSTTPLAVRRLAGETVAGKQLVVFAHESPIKPLANATASTLIPDVELKINRRYRGLIAVINRFYRAGFLPSQIFVAGHSAGAWLALSILAHHPGAYTGAIAFAPAFAGQSTTRDAGWENMRKQSIQGIQAAVSIPSLVYAFANDEWETQSELAFLGAIAGVELKNFEGKKARQLATAPLYYHCGPFHKKFETEHEVILKFIGSKLSS